MGWVKVLAAAKADDVSSVLGTHSQWKNRVSFQKVCSDLHVCTCTHPVSK